MKEVILDTETTGLSVVDGHRIVEIGCIEIENYFPTNKIFHYYLNPQRKVSQKALEVHGYTDDFLADKKKFSEIAEEFLDFINGKRIIIHNAEFDISHLNHELELMISDDGLGLSIEEMNKVFARGFRLDEQKPGTGLGLNIVKDIVETYMKGKVDLKKSRKIGGLEVNILLPLSTSQQVN